MANNSSLIGTWTIYQQWGSGPTYGFPATFNPDGTVVVTEGGGFSGKWQQSGDQVSFTLAPGSGPGSASYQGYLVGYAMGGQVTGSSASGVWSGCQTPPQVETVSLDLMGTGAA
ncbi:MAG TPA: hypothetical protein VGX50_10980 [Longimicrobium sp.]|jgi:hypothetical protein|nr:hypothetical protein [Longimicrobium sp.]